MLVVADDTNYFRWYFLVLHIDRHSFSKWILASEMLPRESLINDDHMPHFRRLLLRKQPARSQRDLHRLEIVDVGHAHTRCWRLAWRHFWLTFDVHRSARIQASERERVDSSYCFNPWECLELFNSLFEEGHVFAVGIIFPNRQAHSEGCQLAGVEARIN